MLDPNTLRILVVDDEQNILKLYQDILGPAEYIHWESHAKIGTPPTGLRKEPSPGNGPEEQNSRFSSIAVKSGAKKKATLTVDPSLKTHGNSFSLVTCLQAEQAVAAVNDSIEQGRPFAVVFLDLHMPPGHDGVWAAENIRSLDSDVNIVVVTAYLDISPEEIIRRSPPKEKIFYLHKPFHAREIYQLASALGAKWQSEKLLEIYQNELESLVGERIDDLLKANVELLRENAQRKQAQEALLLSETKYRTLVNNLTLGIYRIDGPPRGLFIHANPAMAFMFGCESMAGFLKNTLSRLFHAPEDGDLFFEDLIRFGVIKGRVVLMKKTTGQTFWASCSATANYGPEGEIVSIDGVVEDISERKRAEEALKESEEKYRTILESMEEGYFEVDPGGNFTFFNDSMCHILRISREMLLGMNNRDFTPAETARRIFKIFNQVYSTGEPALITDYEFFSHDKEIRILEMLVSLRKDRRDQPIGFRGLARDVTDRVRAEKKLRESEERHRTVLETAPDPVVVRDTDGRVSYVNQAFTRVFGWQLDEYLGQDLKIAHSKNLAELMEMLGRIEQGRSFSGIEGRHYTRDGRIIEVSISGSAFFNSRREPRGSVITMQDITQRKKAEAELQFIAFHDLLTELPNRKSFYIRLEDSIIQSGRRGDRDIWALLFLDLDNFKHINDTLGHEVGDELLKAVAIRIKNILRRSDHFFRLGGDEFTIVLTNLSKDIDVAKVVRKIREEVARPFRIRSHEVFTSVSIGISVYPGDGREVEVLVKNADLAMFAAKEDRSGYRFFTEEMNIKALERMKLESSMRSALGRNEFVLHYQPLVSENGRVGGMEALLRWQHPEWGLILPARFIPLAEETGAIIPIGEWVLRQACRQAKKWHEMGYEELYVAVNLSARQFKEPDLVETIELVLEATGLNPERLMVEVTESSVMDNPEDAIAKMKVLRSRGIRFSIDDFGTGYSSLSYLKRFPIDTLKIDRSFVCEAMTNKGDREIIKTIISMAKNLSIEAVAEGVESEEQLNFLFRQGCRIMQGYYFGRPMPELEFEHYLSGHYSAGS